MKLCEAPSVSGYETAVAEMVKKAFGEYCDETTADRYGNVTGLKKGTGGGKIMFAAHMDEIGLMVSGIDEQGFIKFSAIGGYDQRTLPSQEVAIHGRVEVFGVIGAKPPHLVSEEDRGKSVEIPEMSIDAGFSKEELAPLVRVGDIVTIRRKSMELLNGQIAAKSLDDKCGVASLLECMKRLAKYECTHDVYYMATAQEEPGIRGIRAAVFNAQPDICVAVDVGFARTPGLNEFEALEFDKGPSVAVGPNIHRAVFLALKKAAVENEIPFQVETAPGRSGTDALNAQITGDGPATGLVSIPLKYMHTSVETVSMHDVLRAGSLLACFVQSLNGRGLEGMLCS